MRRAGSNASRGECRSRQQADKSVAFGREGFGGFLVLLADEYDKFVSDLTAL
jgi:hypothetical protein